MALQSIYTDIAERTQGDIYIGVVGPVRTGKSTFIKKFMDQLVIPNIDNEYKRERAIDELPQSATGRTIMTTEPKFVPNEAVSITLGDNAACRVRLIDCVGYIVPTAMGYIENDAPRMVSTPWYDEQIPFAQAAEIGTRKVITEHSTIGILVTTDGSVTELMREDYIGPEERVVKELCEINKPFVVVLNTMHPNDDSTIELAHAMSDKYNVPVIPVDCLHMDSEDIHGIIERVLYEFPLTEFTLRLPNWVSAIDSDNWLRKSLNETVRSSMKDVRRIREARDAMERIMGSEYVRDCTVDSIDLSRGQVHCDVPLQEGLFYKILSENSRIEVKDDRDLMDIMIQMGGIKNEYDKLSIALQEVKQKGYGIVYPSIEELSLEEPEIIRQGSRYGVRLRASAPSIHMVRADIETEVNPIVGTEKQSEELVHYLLQDFDENPSSIWQSNIFGKSLHELVNEGLHNKLERMPEDAQFKLQETLQKIINEGSGGLICIIL